MSNVVHLHTHQTILNFLKESIPHNTLINKQSDWKSFVQFCSQYHYVSYPATVETLSLYLITQSKEGFAYNTIKRRLSTISDVHKKGKVPNPTKDPSISVIMDKIKKKDKNKGLSTPKSAIQANDLKSIVQSIDTSTLKGKRDKTIILLLFATGFRRSEFVSLTLDKIQFDEQGIIITMDLSKTHTNNFQKAISYAPNEYCPVAALKDWLTAADIKEGAIFRAIDRLGRVGGDGITTKAIEHIIKLHVETVGLNPADYAGHSFRRGCATFADKSGIRESDLNSHIGWNSNMAARYKEPDRLYDNQMASLMSKL